MMLSYWEQSALQKHDYLLVGAGLLGMQTALQLRKLAPGARIAIIEQHAPPRGASTRNAGFACFGSPGELLDDIARFGEDATLTLVERRFRGLRELRQNVGDEVLQFESDCGHEVLAAGSEIGPDQLAYLNKLLRPIFGASVYSMPHNLAADYGFATEKISAVVKTRFEGGLDSGRLSQALQSGLRAANIELLCGIRAESVELDAGNTHLHALAGGTAMQFKAHKLILCVNAATPDLLQTFDGKTIADIRPGRGQVLMTNELSGLPWSGVFHADRGYIYFRRVGKRVLLGGARNLDFAAEETASMELHPGIQEYLENYLRRVVLPGREFNIEQRWSGIMGFSADKQSVIKQVAPGIYVAFACNGMGVALSAEAARETAGLVVSS